MQLLTEKITNRLKTHKSCTIFEKDLGRVWPVVDKARQQRYTLIDAFAKTHGWSVKIMDPGLRVTFRKLEPGQGRPDPTEFAKAG
jgi:hypothetical protein